MPKPATETKPTPPEATARIIGVQDALVRIRSIKGADGKPGKLIKNEVIYILPPPTKDGRQERVMGEVLRVRGDTAEAQVFEPTSGIGIGDPVIQSGEQLSVTLGPGLLGMVYDGLQNPLKKLADDFDYLLPRGIQFPALDRTRKWHFTPTRKAGEKIQAGDVLGTVEEGRVNHKILAPLGLEGIWQVARIDAGNFSADAQIATLKNEKGEELPVTLEQRWPVRRALPEALLKTRRATREFPETPLVTTLRMIDTFFPVARGGTACIPGPFGAGKTILQNLISRYSDVDIVIVVACGERAGEVVETIREFPQLSDPRTGGSLMDRTIIICNTSSMPVAAREASIYTGITLGEYYRQMGCHVLLIADSTSRWAQAMRETSGRMEEIPGEEGFPAYLDSAIRGLYERAGIIKTVEGDAGSLTLIGTVSPAGGNFEEPVTQSTLGTVKTFLGLSYDRAYKRFYPAIDPLLSWSRYRDQLSAWFAQTMEPEWNENVKRAEELLQKGDKIGRMMQVTG
jgi:V/A-type H+-transporting ATPase subunit A